MKFYKRLLEQAHPDYRHYYISYRELKRALEAIVSGDHATVEEVTKLQGSGPAFGPSANGPAEGRFQELVTLELDKINKFAVLQNNAMNSELEILARELSSKLGQNDRAALERRLNKLTDDLVFLKQFQSLNHAGFIKIMKKYDRVNRSISRSWFMSAVKRAPFMKIELDHLLGALSSCFDLLQRDTPLVQERAEKDAVFHYWITPDEVMNVKSRLVRMLSISKVGKEQTASEQISEIYLDSQHLDIYRSHVTAESPSPFLVLQWRTNECDEVAVKLEGSKPFHYLSRSDVTRFLMGDLKVPEASQKLQSGDLRPLVRCRFKRTIFTSPDMEVTIDEDITMLEEIGRVVQWKLDHLYADDVHEFPFCTMKVMTKVPLNIGMELLRHVAGFSKGTHAIALSHSQAITGHIPFPEWYGFIRDGMMEKEKIEKSAKAERGRVDVLHAGVAARLQHEFEPDEAPPMENDSSAMPFWVMRRIKMTQNSWLINMKDKILRSFFPEAEPFKYRRAMVRVEPKTFFALERTLIHWIQTSVLLSTVSIVLIHFESINFRIMGIILGPASLFMILWALRTFNWRSRGIECKDPIAYADHLAPILLTSMLVLLVVQAIVGVGMHAMFTD